MSTITIYFDSPLIFEPSNIRPLAGIKGLYFIFNQTFSIQYPFALSKLLYIGMSELSTNSIGNRLMNHFNGRSKNVGISNYRKIEQLLFTYLNFETLNPNWTHRIEDLESYFILNFVNNFGVYPICNNKTGFEINNITVTTNFKIDWSYFC